MAAASEARPAAPAADTTPGCDSLSSNSELPANQERTPGQRIPLSTNRMSSTIPNGKEGVKEGVKEGGTWLYPSPQQFYNAMKRKGYAANETDMDR